MHTRRTLTLVIALLIAGTFAFPSTAAPLFGGPADDVADGVALAPSSEYAYLEDDELVVDVSPTNPDLEGEGLNPDGVTTLGDVFRIQYTGDTYAHVWLTHDAEGISFSVDGQPISSQSENVTLPPNQSVPVSMTVNTTGNADGYVGDITVHARVAEPEEESDVDLSSREESDVDLSSSSVRTITVGNWSRRFTALTTSEDEPVEFDAKRLELDTVGSETLTFEGVAVRTTGGPVSLEVDAVTEATAERAVRSGAVPLGGLHATVETGTVTNATLRFSVSEGYLEARGVDPANLTVYRDSAGEISRVPVRVTGNRDGRVTFVAASRGFSTFVVAVDRPQLVVSAVTLDRDTGTLGDSVTITAVVSNDGSAAGERQITIAVDDRTVAERTVDVEPGTNATVQVEFTANTTGEHTVAVEGTDRGTFVVEPAANDGAATTGTEAETTASRTTTAAPVEEPSGFGLSEFAGLIGMLVIVAVLLALGRRVPRP